MSFFNSIKTNKDKEVNGVWVEFPGSNASFLIARTGNERIQKEASKHAKEARRRGKINTPQDVRNFMAPIVAKHILLDWKGTQEEYSVERAEELLKDPELHDFYEWVMKQASDQELFLKEEEKAEEKEILGN